MVHRYIFVPAALILALGLVASAGAGSSPVRRVIQASEWRPPSPDPTGIAFTRTGVLIVVDSEVEETALFSGANMWRVTPAGKVKRSLSTLRFSNEPTDLAIDRRRNVWYFSHDLSLNGVKGLIYIVNVGRDGRYGTSDDHWRSFATGPFGAQDPEALALGGRFLWMGDGSNNNVYRIGPGADGRFDGPGSDDKIISFDVERFGIRDLEGIAYRAASRTLFVVGNTPGGIAEITTSGRLRRIIDVGSMGIRNPSGLTYGPASGNPARRSLYITDRGVDNGTDPSETDGRIIEIRVPAT